MAYEKMELPIFFEGPPTPKSRDSWVARLPLLHRSPQSEGKLTTNKSFKKGREGGREAGREGGGGGEEDVRVPVGCSPTMRRSKSRSFGNSCMGPVMVLGKSDTNGDGSHASHAACRDSMNSLIEINSQNDKAILSLREKLRRAEEDLLKEQTRANEVEATQRELQNKVAIQRRQLDGIFLEDYIEGKREDGGSTEGWPVRRSISEPGKFWKSEVGDLEYKARSDPGKEYSDERTLNGGDMKPNEESLVEVLEREARMEKEVHELKVAHRQAIVAWKEAEAERIQLREKLSIADEKARKFAAENSRKTFDADIIAHQKAYALATVERTVQALQKCQTDNERLSEELSEKVVTIEEMSLEIEKVKEKMSRMQVEKEVVEGERSVLSSQLAGVLLDSKRQREAMSEQRNQLMEAIEKAERAQMEKLDVRNQMGVIEGQKAEMRMVVAALEERIARISEVASVEGQDSQAESEAQMERLATMAEEIGRLRLQMANKEEALGRVADKNRELSRSVSRAEERRRSVEQQVIQLKTDVGKMVEEVVKLASGEKTEADIGEWTGIHASSEVNWHRQKLIALFGKMRKKVQKLTEEKEAQLQHMGIVLQGKEAAIARMVDEVHGMKEATGKNEKSKDDSVSKLATLAEKLSEAIQLKEQAMKTRQELSQELFKARSLHLDEVKWLLKEREQDKGKMKKLVERCCESCKKGEVKTLVSEILSKEQTGLVENGKEKGVGYSVTEMKMEARRSPGSEESKHSKTKSANF